MPTLNDCHGACSSKYPSDDKNTPTEVLPLSKFRAALTLADNLLTRQQLNARLAQGCQKTVEEVLDMESKDEIFPVSDFISNLKTGGVLKKGNEANLAAVSS
mmetsp:Transcript_4386/g.5728  ORF Transcript_4386/g.5728 Transcript_4386/m.5728 type:complete len:102 (-) Transcript_4386:163-468(-)